MNGGQFSLVEIINSLAILILAALIAWARYRERKLTEKYRLGPNPERCARHEERLNNLEDEVKEIQEQVRDVRERVIRIEAKLNGGTR